VYLQIQVTDTDQGATLTYAADGLPDGLSLDSSTGVISGRLTLAAGFSGEGFSTVVTVTDSASASASVTFGWNVGQGFDDYPVGPMTSAYAGKCLDDASPIYTPTGASKAQMWSCNQSFAQDWSLFPAGLTASGQPSYYITGTFNGLCLDVYHAGTANGTRVDSYPCNWTKAQLWYFNGTELVNPNSGKCLDDPYSRTANGTLLDIWSCNGGRQQSWAAPPTEVAAEIPGTCLTGSSLTPANGSAVSVAPCAASTRAQNWTTGTDGTLRVRGKCLDVTGRGTATGTGVQLWSCLSGDVAQQWRWLPGGLLENPNSGQCLAFPGAAPATGGQLVIKPCSATASAGDEWHNL
jgi:hypothetical protein